MASRDATDLVVVRLGKLGIFEKVVGSKDEVDLESWLALFKVGQPDVGKLLQNLYCVSSHFHRIYELTSSSRSVMVSEMGA